MECEQRAIRLDQINLPAEHPRTAYSPAGYRRLKESVARLGVLVPILVRKLGVREYALVDGGTRMKILRELGRPGSFLVPAQVFEGDDASAVVAGVVVNQTRERLAQLGELHAVRELTSVHGATQAAAAAELGRSKAWGNKMMSVLSLPASILRHVEKGDLDLSHASVIARYSERPDVRDFLVAQALGGDASTRHLRRMGEAAERSGLRAAKEARPRTVKLGSASWVRLEPIRGGGRAELHWDRRDDPGRLCRELAGILGSLPEATPDAGGDGSRS